MIPGRIDVGENSADLRHIACRGAAVRANHHEGRLVLLRLEPGSRAESRFIALTRTVEALQREAAERRLAEIALRRSQARALFLAEASSVLGSVLAVREALGKVARLAVKTIADWVAIDVVTPGGAMERVAVEPDPMTADAAPELPASGSQFRIDVPLRVAEFVLGSLILVRTNTEAPFDAEDQGFAEDLAWRLATAIENARLVRDVREAHERIQEQATELEAQTEELQLQAMQLEEHSVELETQVREVTSLNDALSDANADLERANREANVARKEAERANLAKSQFLTVMSHELRTPMNAIIGYTDLLDLEIAGSLNDEQKQQLHRIRAGSKHLLDLINQILGLARIEAGREEVLLAEIDIVELVREAMAMLDPLAQRKDIALRSDLPASCVLTSDGTKIRQIVVNLLNNAIKFTDGGSVDIAVLRTADHLEIRVRDTGMGIAEGHLERIFVAFEQIKRDLRTPTQGTGLGLSVSKELARLLGGDIVVESVLGEGSTFILRLPL